MVFALPPPMFALLVQLGEGLQGVLLLLLLGTDVGEEGVLLCGLVLGEGDPAEVLCVHGVDEAGEFEYLGVPLSQLLLALLDGAGVLRYQFLQGLDVVLNV